MTSRYNLFTYGTLMIPAIFEKVSGSLLPFTAGMVKHYDCYKMKNQSYPGIVYKQNATTQGIVYFDLNLETLKKLDRFEGDLYNRQQVHVFTDNGEKLDAFVYVLVAGAETHLSTQRWSRKEFEQHYLDEFIKHDSGFTNTSREKNLLRTNNHEH